MPTLNPSITGIVAVGQVPFTNLAHRSGPSVVLGDDHFKWYAASRRLGVGLDSAIVTPMAKVDIRGDNAPAGWPVALAVESTSSFIGEVFAGDPTLSTYSSEAVAVEFTPPALSGTRKRTLRVAPGNLTNLAGGELNDLVFDLSHTVQFNTGTALNSQRCIYVLAPTYSATTAKTLSSVSTLYVEAPVKGTNVTWGAFSIYDNRAMWALTTSGPGGIHVSVNSASGFVPSAAITTCYSAGSAVSVPAGTEYNAMLWTCDHASPVISWSGAPGATQRWVRFVGPALGGSGTITTAATLCVESEPVGVGVTITSALALWVQSGITRFDGILETSQMRTSSAATPTEITQRTATTGSPNLFKLTGAAHTTLSNAEASDVIFSLARTVQFGQNTLLATQRTVQVLAATYSSSAATKTITDAVTLDVNAAPIAGTNVTITNAYALRVQAGASKLGGTLLVGAISITSGVTVDISQAVATSGTPVGERLVGAAHTGLTASADINDVYWNLARTVQRATGAVASSAAVRIDPPTYSFVGASTITAAATVKITGAPAAGTNATITDSYALWCTTKIRIDSAAALGGGAAATLGTIGGAGPAAAAQNEWIAIDTQNGRRWVPAWA